MKQTKAQKILCIFNAIFLGIVALICLLPMINIIALSFSSRNMVNAGAVTFWPKGFTLRSYQYMVESSGIFAAAWITVKRVFFGLIINLVMTILVAYPLSKEKQDFKSRTFYVGFFLFAMVFNGGLIPTFLVINQLGLIDTIWVLTVPGAINVWNCIIMRTQFLSVPSSLKEAAIIDGAGDLTILLKVMLPLSKAVSAVLILFTAVGYWNMWFDPMIYMTDRSGYPIQTILREILIDSNEQVFSGGGQVSTNMIQTDLDAAKTLTKYANIIVCTVPILCVYPFAQKHFVKGVMIGSLKG